MPLSLSRSIFTGMADRREDLYAEALSPEALARQREAAKEYWICCGEWRGGPHHEACKNFVEIPAPVSPDQESLL